MNSHYTPSQKVPLDIQSKLISLLEGGNYTHFELLADNKNKFVLFAFLFGHSHNVEVMKFVIDNTNLISTEYDYQLSEDDCMSMSSHPEAIFCPESNIEFLAVAPLLNPYGDSLEKEITLDVANYASMQGLKTITLLKANATKQNYLNYMSCPKLKGNFYDGDAAPNFILVAGSNASFPIDLLCAGDFKKYLPNKFQFKVTNIWVACQAFNDPLNTTMIDIVNAQKYVAGISDLTIGSGDRVGACTMKSTISGTSIPVSLHDCYQEYGNSSDIWGIGGNGSDYFGKEIDNKEISMSQNDFINSSPVKLELNETLTAASFFLNYLVKSWQRNSFFNKPKMSNKNEKGVNLNLPRFDTHSLKWAVCP